VCVCVCVRACVAEVGTPMRRVSAVRQVNENEWLNPCRSLEESRSDSLNCALHTPRGAGAYSCVCGVHACLGGFGVHSCVCVSVFGVHSCECVSVFGECIWDSIPTDVPHL